MRIVGYVLLIVGAVFEVLMLMARLGGGSVSPSAYVVGVSMIVIGWRLKTYRKELSQRKTTSETASVGSPPAQEIPTRELPITPILRDLISHEMHRTRKALPIFAAGMIVFFLLVGVGVEYAVGSPRDPKFILGMAAVGLLGALIVAGIVMFFAQRLLRQDLQESTYLRTAGPVHLAAISAGHILRMNYILQMSDRSIMIDWRRARAIRGLNWATVDYSRHAKLVFAVWDQAGNVVYRLGGDKS